MTDNVHAAGGGDSAGAPAAAQQELSLERMRRDVAEILHVDPSEVLDDDDLMELGLDSIRLMSLTVRWANAGAHLSFADLAERPELGRWWSLAHRALGDAG